MIAGIFVNILSNNLLDKKNENKEVALDAFLPATTTRDAIQYSM
jgi:hypothetical protein